MRLLSLRKCMARCLPVYSTNGAARNNSCARSSKALERIGMKAFGWHLGIPTSGAARFLLYSNSSLAKPLAATADARCLLFKKQETSEINCRNLFVRAQCVFLSRRKCMARCLPVYSTNGAARNNSCVRSSRASV